jgi:hypothetical protein
MATCILASGLLGAWWGTGFENPNTTIRVMETRRRAGHFIKGFFRPIHDAETAGLHKKRGLFFDPAPLGSKKYGLKLSSSRVA